MKSIVMLLVLSVMNSQKLASPNLDTDFGQDVIKKITNQVNKEINDDLKADY